MLRAPSTPVLSEAERLALLLLPLPLLQSIVISTGGRAFAAAVERPLYSAGGRIAMLEKRVADLAEVHGLFRSL